MLELDAAVLTPIPDAAQDESYREGFVNHTTLARCNFMKALHRAAPLEVAHNPLPARTNAIRLTVRCLLQEAYVSQKLAWYVAMCV